LEDKTAIQRGLEEEEEEEETDRDRESEIRTE